MKRLFVVSIICVAFLATFFWLYQTQAQEENPGQRVVEVEIGGDDGAKGEGAISPSAVIVPDDVIIEGRLGVKAGTNAFKMAVLDSGVGIGTLSPSEMLEVNGNIKSTGAIDSTGMSSKIRFHYDVFGDLPSASTYHGMFAHVHGEGTAYFAHAGEWLELIHEDSSGNVGIGTTSPTNILTIVQNSATDPIADAWTTYSSRRWKTNIEPISDALDKVQRLRGVSYDWKADGKHDIGLIAEEVGEVIPEIVVYEENGVDAKSVAYARLVAVLIEAVKEQQEEIESLKIENVELQQTKAELRTLKTQMAKFESALQKLEALVVVGENVDGVDKALAHVK